MWLWPQVVEERRSRFNGLIRVYKTWGKYSLSAENLTQSGGLTEQIWAKVIKAIGEARGENVGRVVVLGLGGGTAVKLIKRRWPKAEILGVDIDPVMISLGKKYLDLGQVRELKIVIGDALKWMKNTKLKFDVIIIDLYQGRKVPQAGESSAFLRVIKGRLMVGGVAVFNRLRIAPYKQRNETLGNNLREVFDQVNIIKTPANELVLVK